MSLPRRFSISIDGKPVAMPKGDLMERPQAQAVNWGEEPAVFQIENDHLVSGPFVMGRQYMEDRSLMPKRVVWCFKDQMNSMQPVQVEQHGDSPHISLNGGRLAYEDGQLVSPILPDMMMEQRVEIRPVFE